MSEPLTKVERDELLARARAIELELYPPEDGVEGPSGPERVKLLDRYYQVLHEYGDRLPRVPFARCPFTKMLVRRSIDPYGLNGPWWHKSRIVKIEEPAPPPTYQVTLGALDLHGREPVEAIAEVVPGPPVPFVVPRLMELPGMRAVLHRFDGLENGDVAYAISYFSDETILPAWLHQPWLRLDLWYKNEEGDPSWGTRNDPYDFDLARWLESGQLLWIAPGDASMELRTGTAGCPFVGLEGEHQPQYLSGGERIWLKAPDGGLVDPFA